MSEPTGKHCPECGSKDTDFDPCTACGGATGYSVGATWENPAEFIDCEHCNLGGDWTCNNCGHVFNVEPTDEERWEMEANHRNRDDDY